MNFRSVRDLTSDVISNLHRIPADVDLVVGIPRSGMLVASAIALHLNLKVTDLHSFIANTPLPPVNRRQHRGPIIVTPHSARHVLLVDDSCRTGNSLARAQTALLKTEGTRLISTCVAYTHPDTATRVDISFDCLALPRVFEWNVLHHQTHSARYCVDVDGVLCVDPTDVQNDDGIAYEAFLRTAPPLCIPTFRVGHLVTSRLEKYRELTEGWLSTAGIEYGDLHMLDLPDARTRRQRNCHARFKAAVYRQQSDTLLFIESNPSQAREIARLSGKPTLCYTTQELFRPHLGPALVARKSAQLVKRGVRRLVRT